MKTTVTLTGIADLKIPVKKIRKKWYGAVSCVVHLGGMEINAYAVVCRTTAKSLKKWVSTYSDCAIRLIEWGLTFEEANALMDAADKEPNQNRSELKQEKP